MQRTILLLHLLEAERLQAQLQHLLVLVCEAHTKVGDSLADGCQRTHLGAWGRVHQGANTYPVSEFLVCLRRDRVEEHWLQARFKPMIYHV